jgi:hypothetical protein
VMEENVNSGRESTTEDEVVVSGEIRFPEGEEKTVEDDGEKRRRRQLQR